MRLYQNNRVAWTSGRRLLGKTRYAHMFFFALLFFLVIFGNFTENYQKIPKVVRREGKEEGAERPRGPWLRKGSLSMTLAVGSKTPPTKTKNNPNLKK